MVKSLLGRGGGRDFLGLLLYNVVMARRIHCLNCGVLFEPDPLDSETLCGPCIEAVEIETEECIDSDNDI
jgi:hypothetical protein